MREMRKPILTPILGVSLVMGAPGHLDDLATWVNWFNQVDWRSAVFGFGCALIAWWMLSYAFTFLKYFVVRSCLRLKAKLVQQCINGFEKSQKEGLKVINADTNSLLRQLIRVLKQFNIPHPPFHYTRWSILLPRYHAAFAGGDIKQARSIWPDEVEEQYSLKLSS